MRFLYHPDAGERRVEVETERYRYLFRARRFRTGESVRMRNLRDDRLYNYRIESVGRRRAELILIDSEESRILPERRLRLGWCIVDPSTIEKSIAALNEIGVEKISFIPCDRSQKNFSPKLERLERIVLNSCQQCGRSKPMEMECVESLESFLESSPQSYLLDFSGGSIEESRASIESVVVGCEGGFTDEERRLFADGMVVGFDTRLTLRSESAAIAVASKIIL